MRFLKFIWLKIKFLFTRRSPSAEKVILEEKTLLAEATETETILSKIKESTDDNEKATLIKQIARQETAREIIDFAENQIRPPDIKKGRKRLYELHELRVELQKLEEQRALLNLAEVSIKSINPIPSLFDDNINTLFVLLNNNEFRSEAHRSESSTVFLSKSFKELEKILTEESALRRYKSREKEKRKLEELYKNQIKQKLSSLESLINQGKLEEAKSTVNVIAKSMKAGYTKEVTRFVKAKEKLKEKELQIYIRSRDEFHRILSEDIKKASQLEEHKRETCLTLRSLQLERQSQEENKKAEREAKFKNLLQRKFNWRDFQKILQKNNISAIYHFTDHSNVKSIKDNGGLYSWHYCDRNNIAIPMPGNSPLGRSLDLEYGLEDYVRLSFIRDHPMKHIALKEGRISKALTLKVSIEVCYFQNTIFSDMNAADRKHAIGDSVDFLNSLRFDLFSKKYFDLDPIEGKQYQAEILVKTWIPVEYITNIEEIV